MWCGCRMHFPLFTYLPRKRTNSPRKKIRGRRDETGTTDGGITINEPGGGAYLMRRATSSFRCAWRVSSTRSRVLGMRSSFGEDMAAACRWCGAMAEASENRKEMDTPTLIAAPVELHGAKPRRGRVAHALSKILNGRANHSADS
jgi:hypothetical protein